MIREKLGNELLFFDGGMGTLLQERGLAPGELPETWNLTHPEQIREIHRGYIEAGQPTIVLTNTYRRKCAEIPCRRIFSGRDCQKSGTTCQGGC